LRTRHILEDAWASMAQQGIRLYVLGNI
jgi:hypothetical protein